MSVEVQCAHLQYSCDRPPLVQYIDRKPYEPDCNVRLRHDGYRLSERGNWVLGAPPDTKVARVQTRSRRLDLEDDGKS